MVTTIISRKNRAVLIIVPQEGFQDESIARFISKMRELNVPTYLASEIKGEVVGMLGSRLQSDYSFLQVDPAQYAGMLLIGGVGVENILENVLVRSLIQTFHVAKKILMACNNAPLLLARAGVLKGKRATCAPSCKEELQKLGGLYFPDNFILDENILTGQGSPICDEFIRHAAELICPSAFV